MSQNDHVGDKNSELNSAPEAHALKCGVEFRTRSTCVKVMTLMRYVIQKHRTPCEGELAQSWVVEGGRRNPCDNLCVRIGQYLAMLIGSWNLQENW